MTLSDAVSGYTNAAENLGIEGREATFGEKLSSSLGSAVSGLSFGLIDEKNASKGIANFFGAGKQDLVPPTSMSPVPDAKQSQLAAGRAEQEVLTNELKQVEQAPPTNNVVINAPTNVMGSRKSSSRNNMMISDVRAKYTAYERFVDRTFTAI